MEMLKLIKNLITFKTETNNKKEILECLNYIKEYFSNSSMRCEINTFNDVPSIFISNTYDFDCTYDVVFSGHIDVVPATNNLYKAEIKDGYLYGRGAIDMKSQVALMMYILKHYGKGKKLCLLITTDEEVGGFNGTPNLIEKYNVKAKVAVVPDGGYNFQLVNSERGVLQLNINTIGKSVHSSCAYTGVNAILQAVDVYNEIRKILDGAGVDNQTVNLASISTSNNVYNKVPDDANIMIDIRYNINCPIQRIIDMLNNKNINYSIFAQADPFYTDITGKYVSKYLQICKDVLNRDIEIIECPAASDARFFSSKGIPVIMMNPNGREMHGINECIEIESLNQLNKIYKKFLEEI